MTPPTQAVVFCGGRGTRLMPLTATIPKLLAPVLQRPFADYLVEQLREEGIRQLLLLTGHRGEQIAEHFGHGERFGVDVRCLQTPAEWETGARLAAAGPMLDERFLLLYADNFALFRLKTLWERHAASGLPLTVTLARKDKGNIRLCPDGAVDAYNAGRNEPGLTHVEIGYMIVERDPLLNQDLGRGSFSLVLRELAAAKRLGAFDPGCPYHSISDLRRLGEMEEYFRPRRLLLLDRDGVINRKAPRGEYVSRKEDFVWIAENMLGLERLAAEGFEFIILTNQAGIGRGVVTSQAVDDLHAWMLGEMRSRGLKVRDLLICRHHWIDGCACRKPRPGLFFEASRKHGFCLSRTAYVGDDARDVEAAWHATCPCVLVGDEPGPAAEAMRRPALRTADVNAAVPWIVAHFRRWESPPPLAETAP